MEDNLRAALLEAQDSSSTQNRQAESKHIQQTLHHVAMRRSVLASDWNFCTVFAIAMSLWFSRPSSRVVCKLKIRLAGQCRR